MLPMTTLIEDIQALLNPLAAGGAWYAVNTSEPPVFPYIVWQRIVSTSNNTFAGPSDLQNTRIQIDVYALKVSDMSAIETSIEVVMAGASIKNVLLSSEDLYESELRAYRCSKDYSVWATN